MSLTPSSSRRRRVGEVGSVLLALAGFAVIVTLIARTDARSIFRDVESVGFGLIAILALHLIVIGCDAAAWRSLLRGRERGPRRLFYLARWVREATNALLPVAQIGGEVAGARYMVLRRMNLRWAGASVILDKITETVSQFLFTLAGIVLFVFIGGKADVIRNFAIGLVIASAVIVLLLMCLRAGIFRHLEGIILALAERLNAPGLTAIAGLDEALHAIWRRDLLLASIGFHLFGWIFSAAEIWLALDFMGHGIGFIQALTLESLSQAVSSLGFAVPGALGVQEAGYLAIGAVFGLPTEVALAVSLVKRARQILLGLPGLAIWQAAEARRLFASPLARVEAFEPAPAAEFTEPSRADEAV